MNFDVMKASSKPQWRIQRAVPGKPKSERQRTWHPKVRSGCQTCKSRKIRCDETKPACLRCKKAGYECEGYSPPKAWLFESSDGSTASSYSTPPSSMSLHVVRSPSPMGDHTGLHERRALQFFNERTAPILASFAPPAIQFWCKMVPRLSLVNSTIRNALVAVSSLHESKQYRQSHRASPLADRLYREYYAKTISALTRNDQPPPPETVLITCFIFIACENLKLIGSAPAELLHVQSGLKVLREWKAKTERRGSMTAESVFDVMENLLEPMFARLEAQTFLLQDGMAARATFNNYDLNWDEPQVPKTFADLFVARDCMHDIMQYLWYQTQLANGPLFANTAAFKTISKLMNQWNAAAKASFSSVNGRTSPLWVGVTALQIHFHSLYISLYGEALDSLLYWDSHTDKVEWLIDMCTEIITNGPPPNEQHESIWLYDFCLNPPLLLTAIHCRHPHFRRKAIALLRLQHLWDEKDEPWDACWSAKLAEMSMIVEEDGLGGIKTAEDVPESHRIRVVGSEIGIPGEVTICYQRSPFVRTEKFTLKWDHWTKPATEHVTMWPFGDCVRHGNYQGFIRPVRTKCLCKSFGAPVPDAWAIPP